MNEFVPVSPRDHESPSSEGSEPSFELGDLAVGGQRANRVVREGAPHDGRSRKNRVLAGLQPVDAAREQRLEGRRQALVRRTLPPTRTTRAARGTAELLRRSPDQWATSSSSTPCSRNPSTSSLASSSESGSSAKAAAFHSGRRSSNSGRVAQTTSKGPSPPARRTPRGRGRWAPPSARRRGSRPAGRGGEMLSKARAPASAASALVSSQGGCVVVERVGPVGQVTQREERDALAVGNARRFEHHGGHVSRTPRPGESCRSRPRRRRPRAAAGRSRRPGRKQIAISSSAAARRTATRRARAQRPGRTPSSRPSASSSSASPPSRAAATVTRISLGAASRTADVSDRRRLPRAQGGRPPRAVVPCRRRSGRRVDPAKDLAQLDPRPRRPQHVVLVCALDAEAREQLQP